VYRLQDKEKAREAEEVKRQQEEKEAEIERAEQKREEDRLCRKREEEAKEEKLGKAADKDLRRQQVLTRRKKSRRISRSRSRKKVRRPRRRTFRPLRLVKALTRRIAPTTRSQRPPEKRSRIATLKWWHLLPRQSMFFKVGVSLL
jgi:hypothetical protein